MDDALFDREDPDGPGGDDPKVDRVFSEAVERQVAEQRTLNRLVEAATERLTSLEAGIRNLRENTSTQGVSLRAELQEHATRLSEELHARVGVIGEDLDRIRQTSGEQTVRLLQLVESLDERVAGLAQAVHTGPHIRSVSDEVAEHADRLTRRLDLLEQRMEEDRALDDEARRATGERLVERLRVELDAVRAERDHTVAQATAAIRDPLEEIERRLGDGRAADELAAVRGAVDDLALRFDAIDGSLAAQASEVPATLEQELLPLRALLRDLDGRTAGLVEQVATLRPTDPSELRAPVDELSGRLTAIERSLASLRDRLADQLDEVLALGEREEPDPTSALEPLRTSLSARIDDAGEAIRTALVSRLGTVEDELGERIGAALSERTADLRRALDAETEHVAALLEATESSTDSVLAQQREDRDALLTQQRQGREAVLAALSDERARVATDLERLRDDLTAQLRSVEELAAPLAEQLRTTVDGALRGLLPELTDGHAHQSRQLTDLAAAVRSLVEGREEDSERAGRLEASVGSLVEGRAEDEERMVELTGQLRQRLEQQLEAATARVEEAQRRSSMTVVERVDRSAAEVDGALTELRTSLSALTERQADEGSRLDALRGELVDAIEEQLRAVRQGVQDGLASNREAVDRAMDVVKASVDSRMTVSEERADSLRTELATRLEATEAELTHLVGRLQGFGDRVDEQLQAAVARLEASSDEHSQETAATIRAQLSELTTAVDRRLAELGEALDDRLPATLARHRTELSELVTDEIERVSGAFDEVGARLGGIAGQFEDASVDLEARIEAGLDRAVEAAEAEATRATRSLRRAATRLEDLFAGISNLELALAEYLEGRDASLERERAEVLRDLVEEFAAGLSRRERRKLGKRLDQARETVAPAPPTPAVDPGGEPSTPASHRRGALAEALEPETEPETEAATDGDGDLGDGDLEPPVASDEAVVPSDGGAEAELPPRHVCPECGFEAKSAGGLGSHRRRHA